MRNGVFALAVLVLLGGFVSAQTVESEEPWANKLFKSKGAISHDFGVVPRGAQLKHSFKMKNIWKVPMQVTEIRVSCGCVTFTPGKGPMPAGPGAATPRAGWPGFWLQPNEETDLNINMDARIFTGPKTVTIYVTLGPEYVSTAMLRVSAVARQDVVFNPGTVNFGIVQRGETPVQTLEVEYSGSLDWHIKEVVKNASAPFKLEVEEFRRDRPTRFRAGNVGYRFTVKLKPDAAAGRFKQEIVLKTDDPQSPNLTATIEGTVQASLAAAPDNIRLDAVKVGQKAEDKKVIVSGSRPFSILKVDGQGDGVTADFPGRPATSHFVTIHVRPTKAGTIRKQLIIRTDLDRESVRVNVEARAVP